MASDPSTTADSSITAVKTLLSKSSLGSGTDTDESSTINNKESNDTNVLHKDDLIYDKSDQSNAAVNASISNNSSCFISVNVLQEKFFFFCWNFCIIASYS